MDGNSSAKQNTPQFSFEDVIAKNQAAWHTVRKRLTDEWRIIEIQEKIVANSRDAATEGYGKWGTFEQSLADEVQDRRSALSAEWAGFKEAWTSEFKCPFPESRDEFTAWATRLGVKSNEILEGEYDEDRLCAMIEGYLINRSDSVATENPQSNQVEPKTTSVKSTNEERDKWAYERKIEGKANTEIRCGIRDHADWVTLDTDQAVHAAIDRYCKRNSLGKLRRNRGT